MPPKKTLKFVVRKKRGVIKAVRPIILTVPVLARLKKLGFSKLRKKDEFFLMSDTGRCQKVIPKVKFIFFLGTLLGYFALYWHLRVSNWSGFECLLIKCPLYSTSSFQNEDH